MPEGFLLQDLAIVMLVTGLVALVFRRLRQPMVLGYLVAGLIIGPYSPPIVLVRDEASVRTLADLGLVFLMFALGLDFSLRRLMKMGLSALVVAAFEITAMIWLGWQLGAWAGWAPGARLLFGIMIALTSTTIVVKSLQDAGELNHVHGQLISGVAILDDIFVILVLMLLPGVGPGHAPSTGAVVLEFGRLAVIGLAAAIIGLLLVPRFLNHVGRMKSDEILLIVVLGLCFGFSILAVQGGYSPALGAFLAGAMVAESRYLGRIERLVAPLKDMFSAVFFVAMGMLINPRFIFDNVALIALLTVVYMAGKTAACSFGVLLAGYSGRTAIKVGVNMAQVSEFGFVLAAMPAAAALGGESLYPTIVAIAALNALARPYLVGSSDALASFLARRTPRVTLRVLALYAGWLAHWRERRQAWAILKPLRSLIIQLAVHAALLAAAFLGAALAASRLPEELPFLPAKLGGVKLALWFAALLLCLPLYVVTFRKLEALGMMVADITVPLAEAGPRTGLVRALVTRAIHAGGLVGLALLTLLVSSPLLSHTYMILILALLAAGLGLLFRSGFGRWYSRAKFSLLETWTQPPPIKASPKPMPALLGQAELEDVTIFHPDVVGKLIRELALRRTTGASIVGIERGGQALVNPSPDEELQAGDRLLLIGDHPQLAAARDLLEGRIRPEPKG
jgi:CPA2 family monovalent cation:H+ antiporter-2